MGRNNKRLSFGQNGYTLVFDFPIYSNVLDVLNKIDLIVLMNKGRVYMTKDSTYIKRKFLKINKEFRNSDFKKLRKKYNYCFNSLQSERLGI